MENYLKLKETIVKDRNLNSLDEDSILSLQTGLEVLGFNPGPLDGFYGIKTQSAWTEFKESVHQAHPLRIGPGSLGIFLERVRKALETPGKRKMDTREDVIAAIVEECRIMGLGLKTQIAYVLATVEHETGNTFLPVKESYWLSEEWRRRNLRYYPYYGRGYVQITWAVNYEKYSKLTGKDLVKYPDLTMEEDVSLFILVHGCKTGSFTGRKIEDYINSSKTDFINARRVINGTDRAAHIATLARKWLKAI